MSEAVKLSGRRPFKGRLLFLGALVCLAAGLIRSSQVELAVWSRAMQTGGMNDLVGIGRELFIARLRGNEVTVAQGSKTRSIPIPRPLSMYTVGDSDLFVLSLLRDGFTQVRLPDLATSEHNFLPSGYVQAFLPVGGNAWVAGFLKGRIDGEAKRYFYLPEYGTFEWYLLREKMPFPARVALQKSARFYRHESWHEESGGSWRLLTGGDCLILVNDQAESITCFQPENGEIRWRAATAKRPVAAVLAAELIMVISGQEGVAEAFRLADGAPAWRTVLGRGLTDVVLFQDRLIVADWAGDRILAIDPIDGKLLREIPLGGAPRALWAEADRLWIGLEAADCLVRWDSQWRERERICLSGREAR